MLTWLKKTTILILLFSLTPIYAQQLTAHVDRTELSLSETFNLVISVEGNTQASPDLTPLQTDFILLGQSHSATMQIINNQTTALTQWAIQLTPRSNGIFIIPSISLGNQTTEPITITVNDTPPKLDTNETSFLEVSTETENPFVQSQVIYTIQLFVNKESAYTLRDLTIIPPELEDAIIMPLGNSTHYTARRENEIYHVAEMRYALFPQKSGDITIPPTIITGSELVQSTSPNSHPLFNDPFFNNSFLLSFNAQPFSIHSEPLTISVKPIPSDINTPWLPASELSLDETLSHDNVSVGEPITRTITITTKGLTAGQLPSLSEETVEGFNVFPNKATANNRIEQRGVIGIKEHSIAYQAIKEGHYQLPEFTINWWNTETNTMETARLPERLVTIKPSLLTQPESTLTLETKASDTKQPLLAWFLVATLLIIWLITLFLWLFRHRMSFKKIKPRARLRNIKKACDNQDMHLLSNSLITWAKIQWPEQTLLSPSQLAENVNNAQLKKLLLDIDHMLYAKTASHFEWDSFWHLFSDFVQDIKSNKSCKASSLPDLYAK